MKTKLASICLLITLCTGGLSASQYDCCSSDCDSGFNVYADYLYWKVCESDISYSVEDTTHYLNPNYSSGWRIGGRYNCNSWDAGARYTDYSNTKKIKVIRLPIEEELEEEHIQAFKFDWNVVDIELGYTLSFDCDKYSLRPFAGAKLAWIKDAYDDDYNDNFSKQDFDGYGLYLGAEGRYLFCSTNVCCNDLEMSLLFRGSYGILDSTSKTKSVDREGEGNSRKSECLFISTIEVFAGFDVAIKCSDCFTPHILIGYESHTMLGWREMDSSNDRATLGLGGLVARFSADF